MPPRSYTSIFKALAAAACFAAPWLTANAVLVRISSYRANINSLEKGVVAPLSGKTLLIGDCSISPYESLTYPEVAPGAEDLSVIGFGGSSSEEWYYLLENNFSSLGQARHIVIGTSHAYRFKGYSPLHTSFLPWIMTWPQIYEAVLREQRVPFMEGARFAVAKLLPSFMASQTLRFQFLHVALPNFEAWHSLRIQASKPAWRAQTGPAPILHAQPQRDPHEWFRKLASLAKKLDGRLIFMLTPRKTEQMSADFKRDRAEWLKLCAELGVSCLDNSAAMADADFQVFGDGLHLADPALSPFWVKLRHSLRTDSRYAGKL